MITQKFHVRLDFEYNENDPRKVDDELLNITCGGDSQVFTGNPACGPYVTAAYHTLKKAELVEHNLRTYLFRIGAMP